MALLATLLGLVWTLLASPPLDACSVAPDAVVVETCCPPVTVCGCCDGEPAPARAWSLTDRPGTTPPVGVSVPRVQTPVQIRSTGFVALLAPRDGAERSPAGPRAPPSVG